MIVWPFDEKAGEQYDKIKKRGIRGDTMDMKIAAIALSIDATVLTQDTDDFLRVPELAGKVEDWTLDKPSEKPWYEEQ
jgi:tRNA(fMet)-specific endonuclease VapC